MTYSAERLVKFIFIALHFARYFERVNCYNEFRQLACQRGGGAFCSAGKQLGYVGLLDTATQLREALEATAFQNEIIIFAESRISEASQTIARLTGEAGYGHVLPLLDSVVDCEHLAHVLAPWENERGRTSCGAYSSQNASGYIYPHKLRYFKRAMAGSPAWWWKWFTAARAVALGYNVLAVDSDVLVLDDWYWRVKQPPLAGYHMLSQAESEKGINGGFTYVQNAASNGPVAWILYEAMFRLVRWSEDRSVIANASIFVAKHETISVDDQTLLTDGMLSCVAGRPVFSALAYMYEGDGAEVAFWSLGLEGRMELLRSVGAEASDWELMVHNVAGPLAAQACEVYANGSCNAPDSSTHVSGGAAGSSSSSSPSPAAAATVTIRTAKLRMPHSNGEWPLGLGGYPFGLPLGPHALWYKDAFTELGVLLPPNPEDPFSLEAARATKPELFGLLNMDHEGRFLGSWAESSWWSAGRHGYWHSHLWPPSAPPLPQAMGHVFAGLFPGSFQKTVVLQLSGHYDWRVAARLAGSPLRTFHTYQTQESRPSHHYLTDIRLVVAYSPDAVPSDLGKPEFIRAAQGLARVAIALGAVAAWPAAPCTATWALANGGTSQPPPQRHSIPWSYLNTAFTIQPFGDDLSELQCEWVGFSDEGCLVAPRDREAEGVGVSGAGGGGGGGGRALLAVEFHHLRQVLGPKGNDTAESEDSGATSSMKTRRRQRLQPTAATTLRLYLPEDPAATAASYNFKPKYGDIVHINAELILNSLRRDTVTVLWLDRLVYDVEGLPEEPTASYNSWLTRCRALNYFNLTEGERWTW